MFYQMERLDNSIKAAVAEIEKIRNSEQYPETEELKAELDQFEEAARSFQEKLNRAYAKLSSRQDHEMFDKG